MSPAAAVTVAELIHSGEASIQTGPFGTQFKAAEYQPTGTPMINVKNIGDGAVRPDAIERVGPETKERLSAHIVQSGDIVFGRKGAVERHAFIRDTEDGWIQGSDCIRLRLNSPKFLPRFASYALLTPRHRAWMINQCSHGATMASLNQDILGRIRLPLASIEVQRRVVAVLSGYDDLVETNLQRIKVLEDMAAAIYSEWIVNSQVGAQNPPTNSADTHWELVKVSEVADAGRGLSWRREQETEDEASPGIVTIPNVGSRLNPVPRKRLADVSPKDLETYQLHESDILMIGSNGNPERVGQTVRVPTNVELLFASFLMRIRPKPGTAKALLFHQLTDRKFKEALQSGAVGSTGLRNIRITALRDAELMMPPRDLRQRFENAVGPIHRLIDTLAEESLTLARARERLLPRLISGEIDVSELDIDTFWLAA